MTEKIPKALPDCLYNAVHLCGLLQGLEILFDNINETSPASSAAQSLLSTIAGKGPILAADLDRLNMGWHND